MNPPSSKALTNPNLQNSNGWGLLVAILLVAFAFAASTGRLTPHHVDDTASYLEYPVDTLSDALLSTRTPAYPILLKIIGATVGIAAIPILQWWLHGMAAWRFVIEIDRWRQFDRDAIDCRSDCLNRDKRKLLSGRLPIWLIGFSIALGCTAVDHLSTLATDGIAASLGVFLVTAMLRWVRLDRPKITALQILLLAAIVIMIRPAYLAVIPWLVIGGSTLIVMKHRHGTDAKPMRWFSGVILPPMILSAVVFLGLLSWMLLRLIVVNDFGVLPFGHHNLAGITLQLPSDDELRSLDSSQQPLVESIIKHRDQAIERGRIPQNLDDKSTMAMEARWNALIYRSVVPATFELEPDDSVVRHQMIGKLNQQILSRYPMRYVRWLILATRRAIWGTAANAMMNPFLLTPFLILVAIMVLRSCGVSIASNWGSLGPMATSALLLVSVSYMGVMAGFVILTTPPMGRFIDATAIFVPGLVMVMLLNAIRCVDPISLR